MEINLINLPQIQSTNTWLKENCATLPHGTVALTHNQTAGRGQRGNSWEAAPGMNLTFSLLLRPDGLHPSRQFLLSQVVSLAVTDALRHFLAPQIEPERIKIKWPNDIYVDDRKIAGILIEHSITGSSIQHSVVGIGLNVNQTKFLSDAPNPVSMAQLSGHTFELPEVLDSIVSPLLNPINADDIEPVEKKYFSELWRADNTLHHFSLPDGTGFMAKITCVEPDGHLILTTENDTTLRFAFKEVSFML